MLKEEFLIRILACFVLSFLVGIERQYRRRSVGLRTTILVSMGAFLYVCFSFYVHEGDLTRIAAQVVTGIGFLGAGVIIKDGINVRGLTTAATLWCDAAIGILCTGGFLFEAIVGTLIVLFGNIILRFIVGLKAGVDKTIFESIKKFIQQKIEDFNTSDDTFIHMGNICKAVMDEYTNYVDYIEFVNLNDYDAKYTYLDKNQVCVDKIHQVPELLNINRTDNINSDIILLDPSSTL